MGIISDEIRAAIFTGVGRGEIVLAQLIKEYRLLDIADPKYNEMAKWPHAETRWSQAKADFIEAVVELFVQSACNGLKNPDHD